MSIIKRIKYTILRTNKHNLGHRIRQYKYRFNMNKVLVRGYKGHKFLE